MCLLFPPNIFVNKDPTCNKLCLTFDSQSTPPLYDPSKVKVPVAVFRGGHDWQADDRDVNWLLPQLNVTKDVYVKHYEHLDFIWAFDAATGIYKDILDIVFEK